MAELSEYSLNFGPDSTPLQLAHTLICDNSNWHGQNNCRKRKGMYITLSKQTHNLHTNLKLEKNTYATQARRNGNSKQQFTYIQQTYRLPSETVL